MNPVSESFCGARRSVGVEMKPSDTPVDPDIALMREALALVVFAFRDQLEASTRETVALREEIATVRAELDGLPEVQDRLLVRYALEAVAEANRRVGALRQQVALLDCPDQLIRLAGEMVASDFSEHLNTNPMEEIV